MWLTEQGTTERLLIPGSANDAPAPGRVHSSGLLQWSKRGWGAGERKDLTLPQIEEKLKLFMLLRAAMGQQRSPERSPGLFGNICQVMGKPGEGTIRPRGENPLLQPKE